MDEENRKKANAAKDKENSMFKEYHEMFDERPKGPPAVHNKDGQVRMFNQGGYEWKFDESQDKTKIVFSLAVPRFMDTSMLNVDVQPNYVRVEVKEKVTQIPWPDEVMVDTCSIQRSQTTGALCVTATKVNCDVILMKTEQQKKWKEERKKREQLEAVVVQKVLGEKEPAYTFANPAAERPAKEAFVPDFDEDEVPPLE